MAEHKTHISSKKKQIVKDLAKLLEKRTIMIVSLKGLPSSQFQEIRKKLREKAEIEVVKKNLVDFALEHAKNPALHDLVKYVEGNSGMLFSDEDAFELSAFLADNKSPAKARAGQISEEDIRVEAGPTELLPGPAITELSSVGLKVKVENGKIAIVQSTVLVRKGDVINAAKAGILSKLNITPFKIGLEPIAAYLDGKVYAGIKINRTEALEILRDSFARSMAFTVSITYPSKDNIGKIIEKAGRQELALSPLIKPETQN